MLVSAVRDRPQMRRKGKGKMRTQIKIIVGKRLLGWQAYFVIPGSIPMRCAGLPTRETAVSNAVSLIRRMMESRGLDMSTVDIVTRSGVNG
jgi:hypothetical protein